jgi:PTH1 family peptidyl-tRNA hydrolase
VILVVGLGNPGTRYAETRHNVGARVVDELAQRAGALGWRRSFQGQFCLTLLAGHRIGLLKPETFMNVSGWSVAAAGGFYKLELTQLLVVHDELDLPFGQLRLKCGGGDAGHNGIRSITQALGCDDYPRLRFGIGHPPQEFRGTGADFVLQAFAPVDRAVLPERIGAAAEAVTLVVREGLAAAMNTVNRRTKG